MEAKQTIEVRGVFIYFDAAKMVLDKLYAVRLTGVPYVLMQDRRSRGILLRAGSAELEPPKRLSSCTGSLKTVAYMPSPLGDG